MIKNIEIKKITFTKFSKKKSKSVFFLKCILYKIMDPTNAEFILTATSEELKDFKSFYLNRVLSTGHGAVKVSFAPQILIIILSIVFFFFYSRA